MRIDTQAKQKSPIRFQFFGGAFFAAGFSSQLTLFNGVQFAGNAGEGRVRCRANLSNGSQANDNDQSQHDRILDSCWAVFSL
jgi:hypothetical protein